MKSWIMQLWLKNHDESEWPDLSICQTNDACHVLDAAKHPSRQNMERMCSEDFFAKHNYRYVEKSVVEEHDDNYASCLTEDGSDVTTGFYRSPESQGPYKNPKNVGLLATSMPEDWKCNRIYQNVECKKVEQVCTIQDKPPARKLQDTGKNKVYENIAALRVQNDKPPSGNPEVTKKNKVYENLVAFRAQNDKPSSGNPEVTNRNRIYENMATFRAQNDKPASSNEEVTKKERIYENMAALTAQNAKPPASHPDYTKKNRTI